MRISDTDELWSLVASAPWRPLPARTLETLTFTTPDGVELEVPPHTPVELSYDDAAEHWTAWAGHEGFRVVDDVTAFSVG